MNPNNEETNSIIDDTKPVTEDGATVSMNEAQTTATEKALLTPYKKQGDRFSHSNSRPRNNRPPRSMVGPKFDTTVTGKRETDHIPPLKDGDIRIIHFGGVEEIGRNMSMVEYKDSIIIIDCGVQFTETSTPGIDFILPNTRYLEEHKHKIKGV